MAAIKLYDVMLLDKDKNTSNWHIYSQFGVGTEFEAIASLGMDEETAQWSGIFVFKDERFSPSLHDIPGLQFRYFMPDSASGALADARAEMMWNELVGIFKSLMAKGE